MIKKIVAPEIKIPPLRITDLIFYGFKEYENGNHRGIDAVTDRHGWRRIWFFNPTEADKGFIVALNELGNFHRVSVQVRTGKKNETIFTSLEAKFADVLHFIEVFNEWVDETNKIIKQSKK